MEVFTNGREQYGKEYIYGKEQYGKDNDDR